MSFTSSDEIACADWFCDVWILIRSDNPIVIPFTTIFSSLSTICRKQREYQTRKPTKRELKGVYCMQFCWLWQCPLADQLQAFQKKKQNVHFSRWKCVQAFVLLRNSITPYTQNIGLSNSGLKSWPQSLSDLRFHSAVHDIAKLPILSGISRFHISILRLILIVLVWVHWAACLNYGVCVYQKHPR